MPFLNWRITPKDEIASLHSCKEKKLADDIKNKTVYEENNAKQLKFSFFAWMDGKV